MSQPVQHHYLPKQAYLRFFEDPRKPGFVWQYKRGAAPVLINIEKAARERGLYSFAGKDGKTNVQMEKELTKIETAPIPILARLNEARCGPITISAAEELTLARFAGYQATRTPAQRKVVIDLFAGLLKAKTSSLPAGRLMFETLTLAEKIIPVIRMKRMAIARVGDDEHVITSDHPVALIPDPGRPPFYGAGFLMSTIMFPIGRKTVLCWVNDDRKDPPRGPKDEVFISVKVVSSSRARQMNKYTILHAETFLFACENNPGIKKLFDRTTCPERVHWS